MGCFNDDILFIHIPKTGGTSVKWWLWDNVPGMQGQDPRTYPEPGIFPIGHIPLRDVERYTGRSPDSFQMILAIVRDPYQQQLSQWLFWRDRYARVMVLNDKGEVLEKRGSHIHDRCAASHPTLESWLLDPGSDFHLWYEAHHGGPRARETMAGRPENGYEDFGGYYHFWLALEDGTLPQNLRLIDISDMDDEVPKALKPLYGDLPPLPHENAGGKRGKTWEYYSPAAIALVERRFQWAFENLYAPCSETGKPPS